MTCAISHVSHLSFKFLGKERRYIRSLSLSQSRFVCLLLSVCLSVCLSVTHDQLPSADIVGSIQPKGQKFFLFPHVAMWAHFLSRANAQKVSFGIFTRALQHTTFKPLHTSVFSSESVCLSVCLSVFLSSLVLAEDAPAFF